MVYLVDDKPVAVLLRGDHEVQPVKLKNLLNAIDVTLADDKQIFTATGVPNGYLGPLGLTIPVVADYSVAAMANFVIGANEKNYHYINVNLGRDLTINTFADLRQISEADPCPKCGAKLELTRGIEVGHIFKLGVKYSEAMQATFLDAEGHSQPFIMGCYGIGVSRIVAAAIEQNHDKDGIIFPLPLAPFQVVILNLGLQDVAMNSASELLYQSLLNNGIDVLLDDRDERPGSKFKDADLLGIPYRITIGKKFSQEGLIEIKERRSGETSTLSLNETVAKLLNSIKTQLS